MFLLRLLNKNNNINNKNDNNNINNNDNKRWQTSTKIIALSREPGNLDGPPETCAP